MPKLIQGSSLSANQRAQVLAAFVYRWTHENRQRTDVYHCALCDIRTPYQNSKSANGHTHPTIPLQSDDVWLSEHAFYVTKDGNLAARPSRCEPVAKGDDAK